VHTDMHISITFNYIYICIYINLFIYSIVFRVSEIFQNGRELCIFILSGEPTAGGGGHMPTARYSLSKFLGRSPPPDSRLFSDRPVWIKFFVTMTTPE
jgi:hypothetical protein